MDKVIVLTRNPETGYEIYYPDNEHYIPEVAFDRVQFNMLGQAIQKAHKAGYKIRVLDENQKILVEDVFEENNGRR